VAGAADTCEAIRASVEISQDRKREMDISASDFCGDGDPAVDKKRDLCPEADLLYLAGERHVFLVA
jgi:hypothetical protein